MDENNFRKILEEALEPINQKLDAHTVELSSIHEKISSHSEALVRIESVLNGYADSYKENDRNTRKIEKRVQTLEDKAGVNLPPELTLVDVS